MKINEDTIHTGFVRYVEAAHNGYRYSLFVSELPIEYAEGGHQDTHVLVTVMSPIKRAWVFSREGTLALSYVWEKLFQGRVGADTETAKEHAIQVTKLIAFALERTAHIPGEEQDDEREGEAN